MMGGIMKKIILAALMLVSCRSFDAVDAFGALYSREELANALNNVESTINNLPKQYVDKTWLFKLRRIHKANDMRKQLHTGPVQDRKNRFNMSAASQKSQSVVTNIINNTDLYYVVKDMSTSKSVAVLTKGANTVSFRLNNEKGYELIPYRDYRNGWVANPVSTSDLPEVGGNIVLNTQAVGNQGFAVQQGASPIKGFARSHAVVLWPNMKNAQVFVHGMPAGVTVELNYLSKVPDLVFPRIVSVERLGVSSLSYGEVSTVQDDDLKEFVDRSSLREVLNQYNRILSGSNYDYTTQLITKNNSVTGSNDTIPASGSDAWLWSDIPNS